jgi:hypothetical protein
MTSTGVVMGGASTYTRLGFIRIVFPVGTRSVRFAALSSLKREFCRESMVVLCRSDFSMKVKKKYF